jgi:hypothetical protein
MCTLLLREEWPSTVVMLAGDTVMSVAQAFNVNVPSALARPGRIALTLPRAKTTKASNRLTNARGPEWKFAESSEGEKYPLKWLKNLISQNRR